MEKWGFGYYSGALSLVPVVAGIIYSETRSPETTLWSAIGLMVAITVVYLAVAVPRMRDDIRSRRSPGSE